MKEKWCAIFLLMFATSLQETHSLCGKFALKDCPESCSRTVKCGVAAQAPCNYDNPSHQHERPVNERQPAILNGDNALYAEWPWMVAIYKEEDDKYVLGAAVLLAHTWAISAMVAIKSYEWEDLVLYFGEYDTEKKDGPLAPFSVPIKNVVRQEEITCCDQPVLIGFEDIRYSFVVSPICLPEMNDPDPYDQPAMIAGWGGYDSTKRSKVIREEMVKIVSWEICQNLLEDVGMESEAKKLDQKYICSSNKDQSNSVCKGDYGGPLMHYDEMKKAWVIVGILTNVIDCFEQPTKVPGVYMYVKEHLEFITETLKKPCCGQKSMDAGNSSSIPNELDSGL